jgi:hypothetical protein
VVLPVSVRDGNAAADLSRPLAEPVEPGTFGHLRVNLDNLTTRMKSSMVLKPSCKRWLSKAVWFSATSKSALLPSAP